MTVDELIEELKKYPGDIDVNIWIDIGIIQDHFDIKEIDTGFNLDDKTRFLVITPDV